ICRFTSLSLNTSSTALARSSVFAWMSIDSPDHLMPASTFLKSNRWLTSLAAWLRALSTSWRSTLLTMSKEDSEAMWGFLSFADDTDCVVGRSLLYRLSGYSTKSPGGLPERPKGADCKSVGVCLRRFEPCTRHPASRGTNSAPGLRKRGSGAVPLCPTQSGRHQRSTAGHSEYARKFQGRRWSDRPAPPACSSPSPVR